MTKRGLLRVWSCGLIWLQRISRFLDTSALPHYTCTSSTERICSVSKRYRCFTTKIGDICSRLITLLQSSILYCNPHFLIKELNNWYLISIPYLEKNTVDKNYIKFWKLLKLGQEEVFSNVSNLWLNLAGKGLQLFGNQCQASRRMFQQHWGHLWCFQPFSVFHRITRWYVSKTHYVFSIMNFMSNIRIFWPKN